MKRLPEKPPGTPRAGPRLATLLLVVFIGAELAIAVEAPVEAGGAPRIRRPVALAFSSRGDRLAVAHRRGGAVSWIDVVSGRVLTEFELGRSLAALSRLESAAAEAGVHAALDAATGELILATIDDSGARILERRELAVAPVAMLEIPKRRLLLVSSLWGRRLTGLRVETSRGGATLEAHLEPRFEIDLPFSPRCLVELGATGRVLVADGFAGQLAVVDLESASVASVKEIPGHNIRGMLVVDDQVLIAQQLIERLPEPWADSTHAPLRVRNGLRRVAISTLTDPHSRRGLARGFITLDGLFPSPDESDDEPKFGLADPSALAQLGESRLAIAFAGVDTLLTVARSDARLDAPELRSERFSRDGASGCADDALESRPEHRRVSTGRGPTAIAVSPDGLIIATANTFDDSVTLVDRRRGEARRVSLGAQPERLHVVDRGEALFVEARLSGDGTMSCQSCHPDGHSNGQLADTLSDRTLGTPKRAPSLLGVSDTGPWSWRGIEPYLDLQLGKTIEATMRGAPASSSDLNGLTGFLRSLTAPPPAAAPSAAAHDETARRGAQIFEKRRCGRCHSPPEYVSSGRFDVGLRDETGATRFNPPSLRGVGQRDRLFHDNRARSLEDVFAKFAHPEGEPYKKSEIDDLVIFLRRL